MSSNMADVLPAAQTALQSFLQTLIGEESPLTLNAPTEAGAEEVLADCQTHLIVLGRASGRTVFVVALDEQWLPLLSQAMLGEAMTVADDGADDLLRELAAQGYGAVRNALNAETIKLPDVNYLVSLPEEALDDDLLPLTLHKVPFELARGEQTMTGFALVSKNPPPAQNQPAEPEPAATGRDADPGRPVSVAPAAFPDLGGEQFKGDLNNPNFQLLAEVELEVTVELGRRQLPLSDVLNLTNGSVIELEKLVGEPLQIFANGRLIAEGEAVVIDEQFGVRITALASTRQRAKAFL